MLRITMLFLFFILNLLDTIFTLIYVGNEPIQEGNPLMRSLLESGDWYFVGYKMVATGFLCILMWKFWEQVKWLPWVAGFLVLLYTLLIGYWCGVIVIIG